MLGNQGGLASNKFSDKEVSAVEQTGTLSFFSSSSICPPLPLSIFWNIVMCRPKKVIQI
jgi:hypothetical protein